MDQQNHAGADQQTACSLWRTSLPAFVAKGQNVGKLQDGERREKKIQAPPAPDKRVACEEARNPEKNKEAERRKKSCRETAFIT